MTTPKTKKKKGNSSELSKAMKGKTLTGQKPNEIEIFTTVTAANTVSHHPNLSMHNFDFYKKPINFFTS